MTHLHQQLLEPHKLKVRASHLHDRGWGCWALCGACGGSGAARATSFERTRLIDVAVPPRLPPPPGSPRRICTGGRCTILQLVVW